MHLYCKYHKCGYKLNEKTITHIENIANKSLKVHVQEKNWKKEMRDNRVRVFAMVIAPLCKIFLIVRRYIYAHSSLLYQETIPHNIETKEIHFNI